MRKVSINAEKIGIILKPDIKPERAQELKALLEQVIEWLQQRGYTLYPDIYIGDFLGIKGFEREKIRDTVELLMVLGGDGTMLSAARLVAKKGTPILGVNLGGLGFITEVDTTEVFPALEVLDSGECLLEERMMLEVEINKHTECPRYRVLNDVVVTKGALARIIDLETYVDGSYVTTYKADGLILSTPTGSTAYNLSAGGPIVHPHQECIIITPICPHTLTNRPIVISRNSTVELCMISESEDVFVTLDGQIGVAICKGDNLRVKRSDYYTRLIVPFERDYFQVLREKLNWGMR